MNDTITT